MLVHTSVVDRDSGTVVMHSHSLMGSMSTCQHLRSFCQIWVRARTMPIDSTVCGMGRPLSLYSCYAYHLYGLYKCS